MALIFKKFAESIFLYSKNLVIWVTVNKQLGIQQLLNSPLNKPLNSKQMLIKDFLITFVLSNAAFNVLRNKIITKSIYFVLYLKHYNNRGLSAVIGISVFLIYYTVHVEHTSVISTTMIQNVSSRSFLKPHIFMEKMLITYIDRWIVERTDAEFF